MEEQYGRLEIKLDELIKKKGLTKNKLSYKAEMNWKQIDLLLFAMLPLSGATAPDLHTPESEKQTPLDTPRLHRQHHQTHLVFWLL